MRRIASQFAFVALGALLGCAEDNLVLPDAGRPAAVVPVAGDGQSARTGEMLPDPLVVEVRDAAGIPVPGITVRWSADGGTLSDPDGSTDDAGRATARWRLGDDPGVQRAVAALGLDEAVRYTFTASAVREGSPRLVLVEEPPADATSGESLSEAPVVQLRSDDGDDLGQEGVSITVAIASGGGELTGTRTRETDGNGRASFPGLVITGTPGVRRLIFAASGVTSVTSREIDVEAGTPPPPASPGSIRIERGDDQTAEVGQPVPQDPAVKVLDASDRPKAGVTVRFTVTSGGGSVSEETVTTNGEGIASVEWRLGPQPGSNTLRAAAEGYEGSPVTFSATAERAEPVATRLVFVEQPRDGEEDRRLDRVRVAVVDGDGAVVESADHEVTLELVRLRGSGDLRGKEKRRAQNGIATFDDLEVTRQGEYRLRARASGLQEALSDSFDIEDD